MNDPLKPSPALLCKLGSIVVHADEYHSPGGHPFDLDALKSVLSDAEVKKWIAQMQAMALVPVRRARR